ncbi:hypothetical protein BpHYR1_036063 [Brachionus plicatilis]|uniref:Uncharacterized protein n=1 Tax=Brachionus plicatilis TaxID=10195 RepID=A0A3M7PGT4_BRAPC|nr:hypothetical protein BpHYR1_036063 [Brachionus plicatilis]
MDLFALIKSPTSVPMLTTAPPIPHAAPKPLAATIDIPPVNGASKRAPTKRPAPAVDTDVPTIKFLSLAPLISLKEENTSLVIYFVIKRKNHIRLTVHYKQTCIKIRKYKSEQENLKLGVFISFSIQCTLSFYSFKCLKFNWIMGKITKVLFILLPKVDCKNKNTIFAIKNDSKIITTRDLTPREKIKRGIPSCLNASENKYFLRCILLMVISLTQTSKIEYRQAILVELAILVSEDKSFNECWRKAEICLKMQIKFYF